MEPKTKAKFFVHNNLHRRVFGRNGEDHIEFQSIKRKKEPGEFIKADKLLQR